MEPNIAVTLPAFPDAGELCVSNQDLVLIARCVDGNRQLMWVFATEIGPEAVSVAKAPPKPDKE